MSRKALFCPSCAASVEEGQRFCANCGYNLAGATGRSSERAPTHSPTEQNAIRAGTTLAEALFARPRRYLYLGILVVELAIFFSAMVIPIDPATRQQLLNQSNSFLGPARNPNSISLFILIFSNNVRVALAEMVPVLGAILFVVSIFTTGQVIQVLANSNNLPGALYGALLFAFPFSIVELAAYALAVGSGTMLIVSLFRRRIRREAKVFALEILLVVGILLTAAAMETATIVSPRLGFALWIPTGLGAAALVLVARRSGR